MKEEARFQIRGTVKHVGQKSAGQRVFTEMIVKVAGYQQNAPDEHEIAVWDDELAPVARAAAGRQALIIGRLRSSRNQHGYCNERLVADAVLVEPTAGHAHGASSWEEPAQPTAHETAKANGYQPQPERGGRSFTPAQVHEELADEDIPF